MDIRCPSCNKLFRVADEKIAGKGIRFKCSKCAEVITITKDDVEMDLLAREAGTAASGAQPSAPAPKPILPSPPAPQLEAKEFNPREYRPPTDQPADEQPAENQQIPPASLGDFDFREPSAGAASVDQSAEGFGGPDFSSNASQEQATPEIEISSEAAAEAEAALQFPDDLISDPKRKPAFGTPSQGGQAFAVGPGSEPAPELEAEQEVGPEPELKPEPQPQQAAAPIRQEPLKTGPVFTPPPKHKPASQPQQNNFEEFDLGAALRIPHSIRSGGASASEEPEEESTARMLNAGVQEDVHPLASGNVTGATAGLGCAVPLLTLMTLGFGMIVQFMPFVATLPLFHLIALVGSGIISMSVLIGILISAVQARAGKKLFFLVNVLIGTLFGGGLGVVESIVISLVSGASLNVQLLVANAIMSAAVAFILSILVVVARRIMINEKGEAFSADLSGLQKAGLILSFFLVIFAVYETGTLTGKMEQALKEAGQKRGGMLPPAGLQVVNALGYIDPATGDLIVSGSIQNTTDKPKMGWYLVTEVRDAKEAVLTTVKMMNGIQLYSDKERELLAKRGTKVEDLQKLKSFQDGMIPARGSANFKLRIMNPPAGSAGFLPVLRAFDPTMLGEGR